MVKQVWPAWAKPSDLLDLFRLAVPIAVSRASMMLMALTDTVVLSRNLPNELPYILMAWFPVSIFMGLSMGLLLGVSVLTAEMSGRGDRVNSGRVLRRGLMICLVFGGSGVLILFAIARPLFRFLGFEGEILDGTVSACYILAAGLPAHMISNAGASYLEALRRPMLATIAMYSGVAINLALDLALVAGWWGFPQMGADGVASATTGTRWFLTAVILLMVIWFTPGFRRSEASPAGEFRRQLEVGYGMAASSVAEWGAFNFTFVIATMVSAASGSVYGMVVQTLGFVFMAFLGVGTATNVRVAECVGRDERNPAADAARQGILATFLVGIAAGGFMALFPDVIARGFVGEDEMVEGVALRPLLSGMVVLCAVVVLFDGLQNVASMASRALGSVWPPSFIHIGSYLFVMLPLAWGFGLTLGRGLNGIVEGVIAASVLAGVLQLLWMEWLIRKQASQEACRLS